MIAGALERLWYSDARPPWWLRLPEAAFAAVVAARRRRYVQGSRAVTRFETPVVVVGNLSVGGTGKTPVVIALVRALEARGLRCGVVTRGHGGQSSSGVRLLDASGSGAPPDPALHGDEPALIAGATGVPVAVCIDRVAAARALVERGIDVVISDDGLQHYRLARDVEIAVFDGRGAGNGWRLPAGPLRESLERLREVDAVVCNGAADARLPAELPSFAMRLQPGAFYRLDDPQQRATAGELQGRRLHALAGIGDPERFFRTLEDMGLAFSRHPFPDHHAYSAEDLAFAGDDVLLMTEKDAVKCAGLTRGETWVLPVDAELSPALIDLVLEKLRGRQAA